jgi:hypothetical protein
MNCGRTAVGAASGIFLPSHVWIYFFVPGWPCFDLFCERFLSCVLREEPPRDSPAVLVVFLQRLSLQTQPPPMPSMILPVPRQSGQGLPSIVPAPLQRRHKFLPVPGTPGGASSPRFGCSSGLLRVPICVELALIRIRSQESSISRELPH